ncbi:ribosomal protein L11 methyltransferase [Vallitalea longa]|uniref:Ribosomal protein L11 methyltransferase n=1 Tax=Vallitalea longa TaxID=2936439 RepID=A0A9W5YFU5_9FIRM|nr:50S ribosomal protein L11 methyltransferase [Vallitalea longa]GKX31149.1 ribosomal protein L11 methyltransferase [Vallitalea longa]
MKWTMCKVYINNEAIEAVSYMLTQQGIQGVEVVDNTLSSEDRKEIIIDYIEEGVIDNNNDTYVKFYLSDEENIEEKLEIIKNKLIDINKYIDVGTGKIESSTINDEDWANNWKKYYKPFKIDNIIIKPTWEKYTKSTHEDVIIEIDPGMAFGSGTHETTSMCISMLNKYLDNDYSVIDVGCGSGILGITAAKLGSREVTCIDLDKNAVKATKENVITNKVEDKVHVLNGDLLKLVNVKANIVVANIMADIIMMLAKGVSEYLLPKGIFISSGIILDRVDDVKGTLTDNGFEILEIIRKGEWAAIVARPI